MRTGLCQWLAWQKSSNPAEGPCANSIGISRTTARARPPCGPETAGRLPGRPQNAQAETVARQSTCVGEQIVAFRQQRKPHDARNSPALDRHLGFGCGSLERTRMVGARRSVAAGNCRIMRAVHVMLGESSAGMSMPGVPADHHVITAARFGPRRRQHGRSQQRQGCRRSATRKLPRRLRDHSGSEPIRVAAEDKKNAAAQNRHQPK